MRQFVCVDCKKKVASYHANRYPAGEDNPDRKFIYRCGTCYERHRAAVKAAEDARLSNPQTPSDFLDLFWAHRKAEGDWIHQILKSDPTSPARARLLVDRVTALLREELEVMERLKGLFPDVPFEYDPGACPLGLSPYGAHQVCPGCGLTASRKWGDASTDLPPEELAHLRRYRL